MISQDFGQGRLVFGLYQGVERAGRQLAEGGVGRRENGERALAFQGLDKAGGLHRRNQRGVVLGVHGVLDDVLRREHGGATDHDGLLAGHFAFHHFVLRAHGRNDGGGQGQRAQGGGGQ